MNNKDKIEHKNGKNKKNLKKIIIIISIIIFAWA